MSDKKKKKDKKKAGKGTVEKLHYRTLLRTYRVFGYLYKRYWLLLSAAYTGLLLTVLIALLLPWPLKLILDHVILLHPLPPEAAFLNDWAGGDTLSLLLVLVGIFVALQISDSLISYLHKVGLLTVGEQMNTDVRERIFSHLQRLSLSFHDRAQSGDLIYRLTYDINHVKTVLVELPDFSVYRIATIGTHIGLMLVLEWRLALIALSILPVLYIYNRRFGSGVKDATEKKRKKESKVSSLITENVTAMALVQAYGREDWQQARFASENRQSLESGIKALRLSKLFKRMNDILMALGTAAVVTYGGFLALDGLLLPGTLVLFVAYLRNVYRPIQKFADMLLKIAVAQVSCERVLELVECEMVMDDQPGAAPLPPVRGEVEFRQVSFAYHPGVPVLKEVNFRAAPGEKIALVGHSGAGKSTLISLLMRFYDPQSGQILIDGRDIRGVTLQSLRSQITVLLQEAKLFNYTVAENIRFGKADATDAEVVRAAQLAQAHEFISGMSEGYQTMVSEGGENLSGGQRQRINIARAIIRNKPILILDEPATALDAKTESLIQAALQELTAGKTIFIIAHKYATIANADKILVLDSGGVVGFGKNDALLKTCAPYREFYNAQFGANGEFHSPALKDVSGNKHPAAFNKESIPGGK